MIILRIESEYEKGPFNALHHVPMDNAELFHNACEAFKEVYRFPMANPWSPNDEPYLSTQWEKLGHNRSKWLFGFRSHEQLRRSFSIDLTKKLRKLGFYLHFYEVNPQYILFGCHQVAFHQQFARKLR